jgi:adenosylcobinamide-phosphate synthase
MNVFELSAAYIADWVFGDPTNYPHPVKLIGKAIQFLENKLLYKGYSPSIQRLLGGILLISITFISGSSTWAIIRLVEWIHSTLSSIATIFFAYTTLATRNLYDEGKKVIKTLEQGDLSRARKEVGFLVSRDTDQLDEKEVCRALIETVSENTSDGIIAPLFYLTIGGPIMAIIYKAINTLDSMVGYENDHYRYFGWASAKADDLANFIPARITALFIILSSLILGKNWKRACDVTWRDGQKNISPNSGYPEAAVAGSLGIQLGGENFYFGKPKEKPLR